MSSGRTPGRPQLRQRCSSGEEDSEDEVLAMPRLGISLTPDDAAREEDLLEVLAREAVMFELFECVDREAICAGSDEFPRTPRPRAQKWYSALRSSKRFLPCFRVLMSLFSRCPPGVDDPDAATLSTIR
jgi:hypothetical protein